MQTDKRNVLPEASCHLRMAWMFFWNPLLIFIILLWGCSAKQEHKESTNAPNSVTAQVFWNKSPLSPNTFAPLPLGSIKPEGWLRQQLQIQADGLSGHLDEFWPDLGPNSGWLGG